MSTSSYYAPTASLDRLILWLCIGLGFILGLLVYSGKPFYVFLALCVPLSFLVFLSNEILVVLLILAHFSLEWFVLHFHLPARILWGFEGIICILIVKALFKPDHRTGGGAVDKPFQFVLLLAAFSGLTVLVNFVDPVSVTLGIRKWFRYPLMFWALSRLSLPERFSKFAIRLFLALIFLQIPVCLYQKLFGEASKVSTGDTVVGTLGAYNTHALGVLCALALSLLIGLYKETKEKRLLYVIPLLFLPPTVAEVKAFYILTLIVCLYHFKEDLLRNPRTTLAWGIGLVFVMVSSFALYDSIYTYRGKDRFRLYDDRVREPLTAFLLSPQKLLAFEMRNSSFRARLNSDKRIEDIGRIEAVNLVNSEITASWVTTVFGYGIGSYTQSSLKDEQNDLNGQEQTLSQKVVTKHLVSSGLMELGYGGLALIVLLWWVIYRDNRDRQYSYNDLFWCGIARGFQGTVVLMGVSSLYLGSFLYGESTSFIFWLLLALFPRDRVGIREQSHTATATR